MPKLDLIEYTVPAGQVRQLAKRSAETLPFLAAALTAQSLAA